MGSHTYRGDGKYVFGVVCYNDVSPDECTHLVKNYGEIESGGIRRTMYVRATRENIIKLASKDIIAGVSEGAGVAEPSLSTARDTIGADIVQESPYSLTGSGAKIAVWEAHYTVSIPTPGSFALPENHSAYDDRLQLGEPYGGSSWHASHVIGIIAGDGTGSGANKGIAPESIVRAYSEADKWDNEEYEEAIGLGFTVSQNSWNINASSDNCHYGYYQTEEKLLDEVVRGKNYPSPMLIVFSAGNDRGVTADCGNMVNEGYNTTKRPASAKNVFTVGASYSDSDTVTCFSGWGPTVDGRIKPDIVAPGDKGSCLTGEGITSTALGGYAEASGTSMAAPMVSGAAALLTEQYWETYSAFYPDVPLPSTMRALLIQSAIDIEEAGPDFKSGYGRIMINNSVDLIQDRICVFPPVSDRWYTISIGCDAGSERGAEPAGEACHWSPTSGAPSD